MEIDLIRIIRRSTLDIAAILFSRKIPTDEEWWMICPDLCAYPGKLSSSNSIYWQSDVSPILIYISFPMEHFLCRLALWLLNIDKLYKKVLLVLFFFLQPNILNFFQYLSFLRYIFFILKSAAFYEPLVAIGEDYTADQILLYYLANSSKEAGALNWKKHKSL